VENTLSQHLWARQLFMKTTYVPLKHKCSVKTGFWKLDHLSTNVKHKTLYYASIMIKIKRL